jgi:uncharacterized protein YkwD
MSFGIIDIILILLILLSVLNGWRRGFIRATLDLLTWSIGLIAALRFYQPVAGWLETHINWSQVWNPPVAFLLIGIAVGVTIHLLAETIIKHLPKDIHEKSTNRILGVVPGLANGLVTSALVSALLLAFPITKNISESARESTLVSQLAAYAEQLEMTLHPVFGEAASTIARTLNLLTIHPGSHESVSLPYTVPNTQPRPDLEAQMLQLVNKERVKAGLKTLAPDPELTEVARRHSSDMFARGYFAHDTPEGRDPFDRMRAGKVSFLTAGENLALAPTLQIAHTGLMNSPGHRANILHSQFGRVGIGIMDGGIRGIMVTQDFRN